MTNSIGHNSAAFIDVGRLSETDKEKVRNAVNQMADSLVRVEAERDLQKSILEAINEEIGLEKKVVRAVAKAYHKQNVGEVREGHSRFDETYTTIVGE